MEVSLLGPLEVRVDGRALTLGGGKPRGLLAMLALNAGQAVSTDRLVEGLWGEEPPATAAKMVQLYVSQLRKALAVAGDGEGLITRGRGYELRLGPDGLDVARFQQLVDQGAAREALALWRGPPLDDVAGEPFAAAEIGRLEEMRLGAVEQAIDADLAAGRHREVLAELERLVRQEPLRERLHAQRMLALYRSGRQADALAAYRQARRALVERIGVEPGSELRGLHDRMLRQDPALDGPPAPAPDEDARREAARRVGVAAGRVAGERAELLEAQDELAGDVAALQAVSEPGPSVVACPFKGLRSRRPPASSSRTSCSRRTGAT